MTNEVNVQIGQAFYSIWISDEPQALLAAQAAGRAVVAVEGGQEGRFFGFPIPYVVPSWEDVTPKLLELVLRRHLNLPWLIGKTDRLLIRELTPEDGNRIPAGEELSEAEELFRSPEKLRVYCKAQYGFYEYGTWALCLRENGRLAGLAGLSQPRLPEELERELDPDRFYLELGYRIFAPFRGRGLAGEACREIIAYGRDVLDCSFCALIEEKNQASRQTARGLGMKAIAHKQVRKATGSWTRLLLYVLNSG